MAAAAAVAVAGVLVAFPFLEEGARGDVVAAAVLAFGTQAPAHFLLAGWRRRNDRFLAAVGAGFTIRVLVLVVGIVLFVVPGRAEALPFIAALGGFLVAMIVVESFLEHRRQRPDPIPSASAPVRTGSTAARTGSASVATESTAAGA